MKYASIILVILISSCANYQKDDKHPTSLNEKFDINCLSIKTPSNNRSKGQVLYVPVYSNVPFYDQQFVYDISAVLTVHNTDFSSPIYLSCVDFLNTGGLVVAKFATTRIKVMPLETKVFFIPENDTSGPGANFIVEWLCDSIVSSPKVETVMIGVHSSNSVSFTSEGSVIREKK